MSSFSGLSVALSALQSQRRALDVTGQNLANAGTAGYTRQRADLQALGPAATYSLQGSPRVTGDGVSVEAIVRLSDEFAMARLRGQESEAAFLDARRATLSQIETRFAEPSDTGLTAQLAELWATWGDVANHPEDEAARGVMLAQAGAVVDQIASGYAAVTTQWDQLRAQTDAVVTQVNTTAAAVADLNVQIRAAHNMGAPANELQDERDRLILDLAQLTGATVRPKDDGTVDVLLGGTALVRGQHTTTLELAGSSTMNSGAAPSFQWADGTPAHVAGGRLAAHLRSLTQDLPDAAAGYDAVAQALVTTVNALHQDPGAVDLDGNPAVPLFVYEGPGRVTVAVTDPRQVAAAAAGAGQFDGTIADRIAAIGADPAGPNSVWEAFVVRTGVEAQSVNRRSTTAEAVRLAAHNQWSSATSVDIDEEMITMVSIQRAYEGAARMLTAVDQALDVLINRTGLVGR